MRDCAVIGCGNKADPRWGAHGHDGATVMICDGHDGTPCQATSAEDCTCPPIRITAEPYRSVLAVTEANCDATHDQEQDRQPYRIRIEGKNGQVIEITEEMAGGFSIQACASLNSKIIVEPLNQRTVLVSMNP